MLTVSIFGRSNTREVEVDRDHLAVSFNVEGNSARCSCVEHNVDNVEGPDDLIGNSVDNNASYYIARYELAVRYAAYGYAFDLNVLYLVYLTGFRIVLGSCGSNAYRYADEYSVNAVIIGVLLVVINDIIRNVFRYVRGDRIADIIN